MVKQSQIEEAFASLVSQHKAKRSTQQATGRECVLQYLYENQYKIWWWSWEFIGQTTKKGQWLSHRAPARASDLAIHEPELVEHRKIGRYSVYRLRSENIELIEERLFVN